ncbi:cache domain protein (macronuclear) [Tetrahymena thermophila SB210]|uniref:Cache domain protein n=1 Tax=Tetrahymena thermophila (strain SB210) TaxID=312017 RepID=Q22NR1_TETTS|nr:cache domain protein [Tetrahymena thermophila SB210]EAR86724.2 cache domain protein [Tetrahymena thermophila SB210]|eukprot:XP_001006969.2 cache domain protein [Tetrahymena thermophila SB210]
MLELRKRQSSQQGNGGTIQNNLEVSRESKVKTLSMQQSLSKRMITFEQRQTLKEQQNLEKPNNNNNNNNTNMLTSFNNNLSKQQSTSKIKHEIDGKYSMTNIPPQQNTQNMIQENEVNKKGIFEEYQERWKQNNKKIFRYLITWQVGDDGKIEDQLKLMITYLSIIFIIILFLCGFATTYYFHQTNKENIQQAIESQAQTILQNSLIQYKNSTEYIFKGYEFVLNYLSDLILSKLQISYKVYDFSHIKQFPYKGPSKMHMKNDPDKGMCPLYTGNVNFDPNGVSLECIDWFEFDKTTQPLNNQYVYQQMIDTNTLNGAIDILNYVLESQIFDVFVTKLYKIYFAFEYRQVMYGYPGLIMGSVPDSYRVHERGWYNNTRNNHINQPDNQVYRVISTPYYDAGSGQRVVTISKAILAPAKEDTDKRYLVGKGLFMGVASLDIKIGEFQQLFQDIVFYDTGYLVIVNIDGNLLNEPTQFIKQVGLQGKTYQNLSITQLIPKDKWDSIYNQSQEYLLQTITSVQGQDLVVASTINSENYYKNQQIVIMLIIPYNEVYGEIDNQNSQNLENILISSIVSLVVFVIATIFCMIYVKKKIVNMVSAISELNKCALSLTSGSNNPNIINSKSDNKGNISNSIPIVSNSDGTHSKREVMEKLNQIQKNSQSQTIKDLVKGFENQLKGISKLGKGGQNILKNGKASLKYEQAEFGGTQLQSYIEPLLTYLNMKKEKFDTEPSFQISNYSALSQMQIKTLTSQFKKNNMNNNNNNFTGGTQQSPLQTAQKLQIKTLPEDSNNFKLAGDSKEKSSMNEEFNNNFPQKETSNFLQLDQQNTQNSKQDISNWNTSQNYPNTLNVNHNATPSIQNGITSINQHTTQTINQNDTVATNNNHNNKSQTLAQQIKETKQMPQIISNEMDQKDKIDSGEINRNLNVLSVIDPDINQQRKEIANLNSDRNQVLSNNFLLSNKSENNLVFTANANNYTNYFLSQRNRPENQINEDNLIAFNNGDDTIDVDSINFDIIKGANNDIDNQ